MSDPVQEFRPDDENRGEHFVHVAAKRLDDSIRIQSCKFSGGNSIEIKGDPVAMVIKNNVIK